MPEARGLFPTGSCYCGCGSETPRGSLFAPGHDKKAESMVIKIHYGGVADFLDKHGYGPHRKNLHKAYEDWKRRSGEGR